MIHPNIKKFWEDKGFEVKPSSMVHSNIECDDSVFTNELFYAWKADDNYLLIADISTYKNRYYFEWSCYSEEEMLKIVNRQ